jgi:hypothetical protein
VRIISEGVLAPIDGMTLILEVQRQSVLLQRQSGTELVSGTRIQLDFTNVLNAPHVGDFDGFSISTSIALQDGGNTIDKSDLQTVSIIAGNLAEAKFIPLTAIAFAKTQYLVSFRLGNSGLPANSSLLLTFPAGTNLSGATLSHLILNGSDYASQYVANHGSIIEISTFQTLRISLHKLIVPSMSSLVCANRPSCLLGNQKVNLKINGIRNSFAGNTGTFQLRTMTSFLALPQSVVGFHEVLMERDLAVSSYALQPAKLTLNELSLSVPR